MQWRKMKAKAESFIYETLKDRVEYFLVRGIELQDVTAWVKELS